MIIVSPQGPGFLLFFQEGSRGGPNEKEVTQNRLEKDDQDILEILTLLATTNVL